MASSATAAQPVGRATAAARATSAGWGDPQLIDPKELLSHVSCTSPVFCAAVDGFGYAMTYDGTTWSTPLHIDPLHGHPHGFTDVSCVSAAFCMAVDTRGRAFTYRHSAWSGPVKVGTYLNGVTCLSRSFCVAVNAEPWSVFTYNGSSWQHTADFPHDTGAVEVSCASETMCVAVGGPNALNFDGTTWAATRLISPLQPYVYLESVSCVTVDYCVTVDGVGRAYTYDGSGWSKPVRVAHVGHQSKDAAVSCGAVGRCVMVTWKALASILTGGDWSAPEPIDSLAHGYLVSVSCSGPHFCVAVHHGFAITYRS